MTVKYYFLSLFIFCCNATLLAQSTVKILKATEFNRQLSETDSVQLIDVRTLDEYKNGHLAHALNLNIQSSEFDHQVAALNKNKPLFVYCLSGGRSSRAIQKLQKLGFKEIHELEGGILSWRAANLPENQSQFSSKEITLDHFKNLIKLKQNILIDFYAPWCAPCAKMKPGIDNISLQMKDQLNVIQINIDENPTLAKELNIVNLPYLQFYRDGKLAWSINKLIDEKELIQKLQNSL